MRTTSRGSVVTWRRGTLGSSGARSNGMACARAARYFPLEIPLSAIELPEGIVFLSAIAT